MLYPLESSENFNFQKYTYQVLFELRKTGFWERVFTGKDLKQVYYIRRIQKSDYVEHEPEILSKDIPPLWLGYQFKNLKHRMKGLWETVYWNNPSEPQELITRMMSKFDGSSEIESDNDYVIFSTSDLNT